jgi:hypothetical protein
LSGNPNSNNPKSGNNNAAAKPYNGIKEDWNDFITPDEISDNIRTTGGITPQTMAAMLGISPPPQPDYSYIPGLNS